MVAKHRQRAASTHPQETDCGESEGKQASGLGGDGHRAQTQDSDIC
jgi:hypothetical protein